MSKKQAQSHTEDEAVSCSLTHLKLVSEAVSPRLLQVVLSLGQQVI